MTDIKMSEVFDGEVSFKYIDDEVISELTHGDSAGNDWILQDDSHLMITDEYKIKAAIHAICNHDRLTAENESLKEEIERLKAGLK